MNKPINFVLGSVHKRPTKPTHTFVGLPDCRLSFPAVNVVRLHSAAGTAQSKAFRAALEQLLTKHGDALGSVVLTSKQALAKQDDDAKRQLWGRPAKPLAPEAWRKAIMTAAAKWGRPEGARGGGNGHKQIDLVFVYGSGPDRFGMVTR
jgi:hypothetical protein